MAIHESFGLLIGRRLSSSVSVSSSHNRSRTVKQAQEVCLFIAILFSVFLCFSVSKEERKRKRSNTNVLSRACLGKISSACTLVVLQVVAAVVHGALEASSSSVSASSSRNHSISLALTSCGATWNVQVEVGVMMTLLLSLRTSRDGIHQPRKVGKMKWLDSRKNGIASST